MKQRDFVINITILIALNLIIKPFWILGIDIGVQNRVGTADYGLYFAIFNFTYLFNMLLDMGITNFNNRNIARHSHLLKKHFSGIFQLKLFLGILYLIVTFCVGLMIGYNSLQLKLLFWTAINQFFNAFILYLRSNISALQRFKTDSLLSVLDKLLMILICSVLLWGNITEKPFKIEWFVFSQTISYMITFMVCLSIVLRYSGWVRPKKNWLFSLMILKKSLPFAVLYLLMAFYCRIDSVMIERLLPEELANVQTGIYASAFRLLDALVMIAYLFSVILLPLFSKMLKTKEDIFPVIKTSFSLLFFFSVTATVILIFYANFILDFLYLQHVDEIAVVFKILIPCIIPLSFTYIFGTLLTANGNMKWLNIISLIGIAVNLLLNFILIPRLNAAGAAITSLSAQSTVAFVQLFIVNKKLNCSLSQLPWFNYAMYLLLLIVSVLMIVKFLPVQPIFSLIISMLIAIILGFILRIISIKNLAFSGERE